MAEVVKPDPDPTILTTEALHREIAALTELLDARIKALTDAVALKEETTTEKFRNIDTQFSLRDTATDKLAIADQKALSAALQTQIESASKTEIGFTKQIDGLVLLINTMTASFNDKLTDLKSRLDRGDGRSVGTIDQRTDTRANVAMMVGVIGAIIIILQVGIAFATRAVP